MWHGTDSPSCNCFCIEESQLCCAQAALWKALPVRIVTRKCLLGKISWPFQDLGKWTQAQKAFGEAHAQDDLQYECLGLHLCIFQKALAAQNLYHRISEQDLCSFHQVSVQDLHTRSPGNLYKSSVGKNLHKRSPGKIAVQDLYKSSVGTDLHKRSLGKISLDPTRSL